MNKRTEIGDAMLLTGDCIEVLRSLPECFRVNCCVTSPPYFGLRDYGHDGQIGLEQTPDEYVAKLVAVFREVRRVLADDGTVWLNLGDSYAGSWGNAGGQNRGKGTQRAITAGSAVTDQAERNGDFAPAAKYGFSEAGIKPKDLVGIPWRVAFALQADGWYLRCDIVWSKPNPMPESVTDRPTKAHEYLFLLSKSARYFYDHEAIKEPATYAGITGMDESGHKDAEKFNGKHRKTDKQRGHGRRHAGFNDRWDAMPKGEQCGGMRNKRSVWSVATRPYAEAHFATFPPKLIEPCILAGCPAGGTVLDPFSGSGTTGMVALEQGRKYLGIELNPEYQALAAKRITPAANQSRLFA